MFGWIADRLILTPTTDPLAAEGKECELILLDEDGRRAELFRQRQHASSTDEVEVFLLKLLGVGGRAESASIHPVEHWGDIPLEIWTVNPPGYGRCGGNASLRNTALTARVVFERMLDTAAGRPCLVSGNSLGTTGALHLAAHYDEIRGLLLRNPPPLRQLIFSRFGWWNIWAGSYLLSLQIPSDLDSIGNAAQSKAPALILTSEADGVVPPAFQELILDAYDGETRNVRLPEAGHSSPVPDACLPEYIESLRWLLAVSLGPSAARRAAADPASFSEVKAVQRATERELTEGAPPG